MGDVIAWLMANWMQLLLAVVALLSGVLAVLRIIPGNQGEAFLDSVLNFIKKITNNNPK